MHAARSGIRVKMTLALVAAALAMPGTAHADGWLAHTELGGLDVVVDQNTPASVTLLPLEGGAETGTQACFTATIRDANSVPLANQIARFQVVGAHNLSSPSNGNAAGSATFCYVGAAVGTDTITVFADIDGDGVRDDGEPAASTTFTWRPPSDDGIPADQDRDEDGIVDVKDNCPDNPNPGQEDADADETGDLCDDNNGALPPVQGKTAAARVVSGTVLIKKGAQFVELSGAETIPVGSTLDTTKGIVRIVTAYDSKNQSTSEGTFSAAVFTIKQKREAGTTAAPTDIVLGGPSFTTACKAKTKKAKKVPSKGVVRTLRSATTKGVWRTKGRASVTTVNASANVITQDRCDGTLTTVKTGSAVVRDTKSRRTVRVRAGRSYLAKIFAIKTRRNGLTRRGPVHAVTSTCWPRGASGAMTAKRRGRRLGVAGVLGYCGRVRGGVFGRLSPLGDCPLRAMRKAETGSVAEGVMGAMLREGLGTPPETLRPAGVGFG